MLHLLSTLLCLVSAQAPPDPADDTSALERFLEENVELHLSFTGVFDTNPPGEGENTGNIFNFIPHGHLMIRHSAMALQVGQFDPDPYDPGRTAIGLSTRILLGGLVAEAEGGEAHNIIQKVVQRNYLEPALRKVFRRKLGGAFVDLLDRTVLDRLSDHIASEILSRVPVTASVREFRVELAQVLEPGHVLSVRTGVLLPSIGPLRDDTGRTRTARKLVIGPDIHYRMSLPGRTLAAEASYTYHLDPNRFLRVTGGFHQAQDPDATLGQVFRNAVFDEESTQLALRKVDSPYLQAVFASDALEVYASAGDIDGLALATGLYYQLTRATALAVDVARFDPDTHDLTWLERLAETRFLKGVSGTLIHDFNGTVTGYVMAEHFDGTIGQRKRFNLDEVEAGIVFDVTRNSRVAIATYRRQRQGDTDTGFRLALGINF